jgi:hypothetical protein
MNGLTNDQALTVLHDFRQATSGPTGNDGRVTEIFGTDGLRDALRTELERQRRIICDRTASGFGARTRENILRAQATPEYRAELDREANLVGEGIEGARAAAIILERAINGF